MKSQLTMALMFLSFTLLGQQDPLAADFVPYKYTIINKTRSPIQIIQEFKGWCGLNVVDLAAGQKNDLGTPCKMSRICFGIDKKLLTCPATKDCMTKDHCWQTAEEPSMEPSVWVIEELKEGQSLPKPEDDAKFSVLERIVLQSSPQGKTYTIARCKPDTLYLRFQ